MPGKLQAYIQTYGEYLEEIRRRLMAIVKFFAVTFGAGFFLTTPALRVLLRAVPLPNVTLAATSPFQLIDLSMSTGFLVASVATVPLLVFHLYSFLRPGLQRRERRMFILVLPLAAALFLVGFSYGILTMYFAVRIVADINISLGVANYWDIGTFASQMILTASLLGILFLSPLILTSLIRARMLRTETLAQKRRYVVAGIFIFVALLPPTDGLSMILMALPLIAVFELTIAWNRRFSRHYQVKQ